MLNRVKGLREGRRRRVPDDTPIFKDWADKRKVEFNESLRRVRRKVSE